MDLVSAEFRQAVRRGEWRQHTAGVAPGYVQANLVVLPKADAYDFLLYCQRNLQPCPLLEVLDEGNPLAKVCGEDVDIRTDFPAYCVYELGQLASEHDEIQSLWQSDWVGFLLGCSFTYEPLLQSMGVAMKHVDAGECVAVYRSDIPTVSAGRFSGNMVVSMRPIKRCDVAKVVQVTGRFAKAHGAPVHIGDPAEIGIDDVQKPDFGGYTEIAEDEVPVFWACGVTPQVVVRNAKLPMMVTHKVGHMLVTDIRDISLIDW